jgi:hypothetical protein
MRSSTRVVGLGRSLQAQAEAASAPPGGLPRRCVAWNSIARAALLLCRLKQQQSGKRLGAMSYLAELLLNALMLFAVELGRVRRRGRRRRLGLNDAVWQGIGLI